MEYKPIPSDRYTDVIHHLRETFFADEPLNKAANLCKRGECNKELEQHSITTLHDNLSVMAVTEDDEIAGVVLNGVLHNGDIERSQKKLEVCQDENFKKIFNLLYDANRQVDFFTHFNVDRVFDVRILSVDSRFRGQGIAAELMSKSEEIAKENNIKVMKADATGIYSQNICTKLGFEKIAEIYYDRYTDDSGVPILKVEPPHKNLQIMFKVLN